MGYYGFLALDLSDQSPMLFVDLLTRPWYQGEALRDPRLRHHLRISIILLLRQHGPDASCHPVGQRDRDQHFRFALQHLRQPTALANTKPCRRRDHRHRPVDQQTSNIFLAHLRDPAEPILAARRVLHWHETEPGPEVPPSLEATHIRSKSLGRQGGLQPNAWHCLQSLHFAGCLCYGLELFCQLGNLGCQRFNVLNVRPRDIADDVGQAVGFVVQCGDQLF